MSERSRSIEQPAVKTTIVGGRPPGPGKGLGSIPRGIEVLVRKAAVDAEFKRLLLERRAEAAAEIGLALEPAEAMMLGAVHAAQLEAIIASTTVAPVSRAAFLGKAAAVMLAALGAGGPEVAEARVLGITGRRPPSRSASDQERLIVFSQSNWRGEVSCDFTTEYQFGHKVADTDRINNALRAAYLAASEAWS